jgi:hypothetical protein
MSDPSFAAVRIGGQVRAGGGPLAGSTVTLWAAGATGSNKAGSDGRFELGTAETTANDVVLYLTAKEGEASINKGQR